MGSPFYAYLKYDQDYRDPYLITFVDREAADEWWRLISTSPSPFATNVERVSPQFYIQNDPQTYNVVRFLSHPTFSDARQFFKKMIFTELDSYKKHPFTVPPTTIVDHISGRWYFIRSKADPWSFWYFRTNDACLVCGDANCDAVHVSSEYRTKFRVRVCNLADDFQVPENFVMVEKDEISIAAPMDYTIHINDAGQLKATEGYQGETYLRFDDLKNRFITRPRKQVNGEIWEYVVRVETGLGEGWGLVA